MTENGPGEPGSMRSSRCRPEWAWSLVEEYHCTPMKAECMNAEPVEDQLE
jgi:hypothetical protein